MILYKMAGRPVEIFLILVLSCVIGFSCAVKMNKANDKKSNQLAIDPNLTIERELFLHCPVYDGPDSVISFLEKKPEFLRNKEYDYGNGSVRFNGKNAFFDGYPLVDDKSLFLLNYSIVGEHKFSLFQAIYHFKNKTDKQIIYEKMINTLDNILELSKMIQYDAIGNAYNRYFLPDGSGLNFKHSPEGMEKYFIDIVWVPQANR